MAQKVYIQNLSQEVLDLILTGSGGTITPEGTSLKFSVVADFPQITDADKNTIYINSQTGEVVAFDGLSFITIVKPSPAAFLNNPGQDALATQKAVADYVSNKLQLLDIDGIELRLQNIESALQWQNLTI